MTALPRRVKTAGSAYVLTFHKCGSQWVRDVLWDGPVLEDLELEAGRQGVDMSDWPEAGSRRLHAPVYSVSFATWLVRRRRGDRAIVVLRDPRDMAVSWIASVTHSHTDSPVTSVRDSMRTLSPREQLLTAMAWLSTRVPAMRSWRGRQSGDEEFVTSYERLVEDSTAEFGNMVDFLGGDPLSPVLAESISRHSFVARSGRERGTEDVFSHYRRGVVNDWTRWFDRPSGHIFEVLFPSLLVDLGYETSTEWYQRLPLTVEVALPPVAHDAADLLVELRRVQQENLLLRRACDERLALIESLSHRLEDAEIAAARTVEPDHGLDP